MGDKPDPIEIFDDSESQADVTASTMLDVLASSNDADYKKAFTQAGGDISIQFGTPEGLENKGLAQPSNEEVRFNKLVETAASIDPSKPADVAKFLKALGVPDGATPEQKLNGINEFNSEVLKSMETRNAELLRRELKSVQEARALLAEVAKTGDTSALSKIPAYILKAISDNDVSGVIQHGTADDSKIKSGTKAVQNSMKVFDSVRAKR